MPELSIIIVSYNTCTLTVSCIKSIYTSSHYFSFEIILVDHDFTDNTLKEIGRLFPGVIIVKNRKNFKFERDNNPGVRFSKGKYLLLLNSDTIVYERDLEKMLGFMDILFRYLLPQDFPVSLPVIKQTGEVYDCCMLMRGDDYLKLAGLNESEVEFGLFRYAALQREMVGYSNGILMPRAGIAAA